MIVCFSGTGNTRYLASQLKKLIGDETLRVAPGYYRQPQSFKIVVPDGRLIWAFPTHCWGLPKYTKLIMENCQVISADGSPVVHYMVTSCGDDVGLCANQWRDVLSARGFRTATAFSVQMPNTYTFMYGFDVDSKYLEEKKQEEANKRIKTIAAIIESGENHPDMLVRGKFPWIKTRILYPIFMRWKTDPKKFAVSDKCNGCGMCMRLCPLANITMNHDTNKPVWGEVCTMCTRCYHICPNHAIDYDNTSASKGQYLHPIFTNHHVSNQKK